MADLIFKGKAWVLRDENGNMIPNIDTDMIYHNAHLAVTEIEKMGQYALGNLEGYKDFPQKAQRGNIVVAGSNFGSGSSRQHGVDCFKALGISCLVVESVGAIYKRNAINSGFPLIIVPDLSKYEKGEPGYIESGDVIEVDCQNGKITNVTKGYEIPGVKKMSQVQFDIYQAGSLFEYGKMENR